MIKQNNRVRVVSYILEEAYNNMEAERKVTKESQSGIVASVLEAVFMPEENKEA